MVIDDKKTYSPLDASVLVLNRLYMVARVVSARRAFILLCRNAAEVIAKYNGSFLNYSFSRWIEESHRFASLGSHHPVRDTTRERKSLEEEEFIRTPTLCIGVPRVIRLLHYDKMPKPELRLNRKYILLRDNQQCQYCGRSYPPVKLSIDHIIPRSRKGGSTWDNMVACCSRCNTKKGGRLPQEAGMKLIRKPTPPGSIHHFLFLKQVKDKRYAFWKEFLHPECNERVTSDAGAGAPVPH